MKIEEFTKSIDIKGCDLPEKIIKKLDNNDGKSN